MDGNGVGLKESLDFVQPFTGQHLIILRLKVANIKMEEDEVEKLVDIFDKDVELAQSDSCKLSYHSGLPYPTSTSLPKRM